MSQETPQRRATENGRFLLVRHWHVIVLLVGWVITAAAGYATLRANSDENARRISDLEHRTFVTREEYEARGKELNDRLERIEKKLDDGLAANRRFLGRR
jgi:hypothetical protein